jgi:hypothetical protein
MAIYEHYLPRYTGDAVPKGTGLVVGIADRLTPTACSLPGWLPLVRDPLPNAGLRWDWSRR